MWSPPSSAAAIFVVTNQLTVHSLLEARLPQDKNYVNNGLGFWLCLITLVVTMALSGIGWLRAAARQ